MLIEGLTHEQAAALIRRCRYFDIVDALLSGERLQVTIKFLDRIKRARQR